MIAVWLATSTLGTNRLAAQRCIFGSSAARSIRGRLQPSLGERDRPLAPPAAARIDQSAGDQRRPSGVVADGGNHAVVLVAEVRVQRRPVGEAAVRRRARAASGSRGATSRRPVQLPASDRARPVRIATQTWSSGRRTGRPARTCGPGRRRRARRSTTTRTSRRARRSSSGRGARRGRRGSTAGARARPVRRPGRRAHRRGRGTPPPRPRTVRRCGSSCRRGSSPLPSGRGTAGCRSPGRTAARRSRARSASAWTMSRARHGVPGGARPPPDRCRRRRVRTRTPSGAGHAAPRRRGTVRHRTPDRAPAATGPRPDRPRDELGRHHVVDHRRRPDRAGVYQAPSRLRALVTARRQVTRPRATTAARLRPSRRSSPWCARHARV